MQLSAETIDEIPAMVGELLALPDESDAESDDISPSTATPTPDTDLDLEVQDEPGGGGVPVAPLILASAGVLMTGGGVLFAALMRDTERDYHRLSVMTESQARAAQDAIDTGQRQELIANTLLVAGAATMLVGGIWFALALGNDDERAPTALAPSVSPEYAGLSLSGVWEGM